MPKARPRQCPKCSKGMIRSGVCSHCGHKPEQWNKGKSGTDKYRSLYGRRWREAKANFLAEHPLCAWCRMDGLVVAATVVDHVTPHQGDKTLFWDASNWQALCKRCHDRKSAREAREGGGGS